MLLPRCYLCLFREEGFGLIIKVCCHRLPKCVPSDCMHNYGTYTKSQLKVERYLRPILVVKKDKASERGDEYERVKTTFRSIPYCNIQAVNMMNQCSY